jgi:hypothetical protein
VEAATDSRCFQDAPSTITELLAVIKAEADG